MPQALLDNRRGVPGLERERSRGELNTDHRKRKRDTDHRKRKERMKKESKRTKESGSIWLPEAIPRQRIIERKRDHNHRRSQITKKRENEGEIHLARVGPIHRV